MLARFSHVQLSATLWTVAHQAPLSMGFSRQEHCSGLLCPPTGDLLTQELNPCPLSLLHWQVGSLPLVPSGNSGISLVLMQLHCHADTIFMMVQDLCMPLLKTWCVIADQSFFYLLYNMDDMMWYFIWYYMRWMIWSERSTKNIHTQYDDFGWK